MQTSDLLNFAWEHVGKLDARKRVFVMQARLMLKQKRPLTLAQEQYVQACYDQAIERAFDLEPMAGEKDQAVNIAIARRQREKFKGLQG